MSYAANRNHKFLKIPDEVMARYNAFDCYFTARLAQALHAVLETICPVLRLGVS